MQKKCWLLQKIINEYFYLLTRAAKGVFAKTVGVNTLRKIMSKFEETSLLLFFCHIYPANVRGAAIRSTKSTNSTYLILIMVVGALVVSWRRLYTSRAGSSC